MAVPNINTIITRKSGFNKDLYMVLVEIPLATLSVTGNVSLLNKYPYTNVGIAIRPTCTCQPIPALFKKNTNKVPITIPPGNQR